MWENVGFALKKNITFHLIGLKNKNFLLLSDSALKGMWACSLCSISARISALCIWTGPGFTLSQQKDTKRLYCHFEGQKSHFYIFGIPGCFPMCWSAVSPDIYATLSLFSLCPPPPSLYFPQHQLLPLFVPPTMNLAANWRADPQTAVCWGGPHPRPSASTTTTITGECWAGWWGGATPQCHVIGCRTGLRPHGANVQQAGQQLVRGGRERVRHMSVYVRACACMCVH